MTDRDPDTDRTEVPVVRPAAGPVTPAERIAALDVLRGVAVLGILTMNISLALPGPSRSVPTVSGGFDGANFVLWLVGFLLFDEKMVSLFSMLFGAGMVLQARRAVARRRSPAALFYRRAVVLLVFGLLHAYLVWEGDILYHYALVGMLVYLLRRTSPRTLLAVGIAVQVVGWGISFGFSALVAEGRAAAWRVEAARAAGAEPGATDQAFAEMWDEMRKGFAPPREELDRLLRVYGRGTYPEVVADRAGNVLVLQTVGFALFLGWIAGGRMLVGMALMKLGVFSAERSRRFYLGLLLLCYGIGYPLVVAAAIVQVRTDFDAIALLGGGGQLNSAGSALVSIGHAAAVILLYRAFPGGWLTRRLAAVGRMALTNYLMQSVIATTIFYGYGFGLYGTLDRVGLAGVVAAVWAVQLWLSPVWLARFRFGPAEWLWRSLTYGRAEPFRA